MPHDPSVTWFRVDDKLHDHRKARRAGLEAMGLWLVAGSWCGDNLTDGFIPADVLDRWSKHPAKLAAKLVEVGLWEPDTRDGEAGFSFHEWTVHQPTRQQVEERREKRRAAGAAGGQASASARATARAQALAAAGAQAGPNPVPSRPVPSRSSPLVSQVQQPTGAPNTDRLDLDKIQEELHCDRAHALRVSREILGRAAGDVRNPQSFILKAIAGERARYTPTALPTTPQRCQHGRRFGCGECLEVSA